jgi:hypothetical protein
VVFGATLLNGGVRQTALSRRAMAVAYGGPQRLVAIAAGGRRSAVGGRRSAMSVADLVRGVRRNRRASPLECQIHPLGTEAVAQSLAGARSLSDFPSGQAGPTEALR